MQIVMVKQV